MDVYAQLAGEPLAIDLVNTRLRLPNIGWSDVLDTLDGFRDWVAFEHHQHGRLAVDPHALIEADLKAVHRLRRHIAAALDRARHGERPNDADLDGINRALRASAQTQRLTWSATQLTQQTVHSRGAGAALLTQLGQAAADLLTDPKVTSVRDCAMPDCVAVFYPTNPRRKWCSDALCGNRARVARHYRRHRGAMAERAVAGDSEPEPDGAPLSRS